jgi:ribosomal protein S26
VPRTRTCWRCGRDVPAEEAVRKEVRTGSSRGRSYRSYYGRRTLCQECAAIVDRNRAIQGLVFVAALAGLAIWWFLIR